MIKRQCRVGWDEMHIAGSRRVSQEGLELVANVSENSQLRLAKTSKASLFQGSSELIDLT